MKVECVLPLSLTVRVRDNAFSASLPQNGSEEAERHSVAGKEAERAEIVPQNEAQGVESHSVAMLAVSSVSGKMGLVMSK